MGRVGIPFSETDYRLWSQTSQTRLYYLAGDLGPVTYYSLLLLPYLLNSNLIQKIAVRMNELTYATYEITTFIGLNDQISASSHDSIKHLKHTA